MDSWKRASLLAGLDERIAARVLAITAEHPGWRCRRGCDACCRNLGEMPHATFAEWARVFDGVASLPPAEREAVHARVDAFVSSPTLSACPFLDEDAGICRVYAQRMLACRAYGYFSSRREGRYCRAIELDVAAKSSPVLFGNFDAVLEDADAGLGPRQTLAEWWRTHRP